MNTTQYFSLPQFSGEDKFNIEDFNEAFFNIDNAIQTLVNAINALPEGSATLLNAEFIATRTDEENNIIYDTASERLRAMQDATKEAKNKADTNSTNIDSINTLITQIQSTISALDTTLKSTSSKSSTNANDIKNLNSSLNSLKTTVNTLSSSVTNNTSNISANSSSITSLSNKLTNMQSNITTNSNSIKNNQTSISNILEKISNLTSTVNSLSSSGSSASSSITSLTNQLTSLSNTVDGLKDKVDTYSNVFDTYISCKQGYINDVIGNPTNVSNMSVDKNGTVIINGVVDRCLEHGDGTMWGLRDYLKIPNPSVYSGRIHKEFATLSTYNTQFSGKEFIGPAQAYIFDNSIKNRHMKDKADLTQDGLTDFTYASMFHVNGVVILEANGTLSFEADIPQIIWDSNFDMSTNDRYNYLYMVSCEFSLIYNKNA